MAFKKLIGGNLKAGTPEVSDNQQTGGAGDNALSSGNQENTESSTNSLSGFFSRKRLNSFSRKPGLTDVPKSGSKAKTRSQSESKSKDALKQQHRQQREQGEQYQRLQLQQQQKNQHPIQESLLEHKASSPAFPEALQQPQNLNNHTEQFQAEPQDQQKNLNGFYTDYAIDDEDYNVNELLNDNAAIKNNISATEASSNPFDGNRATLNRTSTETNGEAIEDEELNAFADAPEVPLTNESRNSDHGSSSQTEHDAMLFTPSFSKSNGHHNGHDQASKHTMSSIATTTAGTVAPESSNKGTSSFDPVPLTESRETSDLPKQQLSEPFVPASDFYNKDNKIEENAAPSGLQLQTQTTVPTFTTFENEHEFILPFGDGAFKIFGMENFGASCYCNSIVQSLFYTKLFRQLILSLPNELNVSLGDPNATPRKRKLTMEGLKAHHFITALQNNKIDENGDVPGSKGSTADMGNDNDNSNNNNNDSNENEGSKIGRRMSIFGRKDKNKDHDNTASRHGSVAAISENLSSKDGSNGSKHGSAGNSASNANLGESANGEQRVYRAQSKYPGLRALNLGFEVPNRNVTIVGVIDDVNATAEQRKRKALVTGPILNIDHALTTTDTMFDALKDIFECMVEHESQVGVVSPLHLLEVLKKENELFRSMMHQDAHEFFNYLLNSVFESIDAYHNSKKEFINEIADSKTKSIEQNKLQREVKWSRELFEGLLTSQTKCLRCEKISSRDEKFLDLSIDLENDSSVTACLKQFSANELLCEDNKFYCEHCSALQEATKRMIIKKLPKILTLHLKRFKYSEQLNRNIKLFHRVSYPLYLRLFNTLSDTTRQDRVYELYSVVVHIGGGPYHGHYVSLVKTEQSGWLLFDDETVESIDENYVLRFFGDGPGLASAYILFYQEISEEDYLNKTLYKSLDLSLDLEDEIEEEINAGVANAPTIRNDSEFSSSGFHIPDFKRKNSADTQQQVNHGLSPIDAPKHGKSGIEAQRQHRNSNNANSPISPAANLNDSGKSKRTRSISLKSPLSNSFKFSSSNNNSASTPGTAGSDSVDPSIVVEEPSKNNVVQMSVDGNLRANSLLVADNTDSNNEEKPHERRKSLFGFNKKSKSKK